MVCWDHGHNCQSVRITARSHGFTLTLIAGHRVLAGSWISHPKSLIHIYLCVVVTG